MNQNLLSTPEEQAIKELREKYVDLPDLTFPRGLPSPVKNKIQSLYDLARLGRNSDVVAELIEQNHLAKRIKTIVPAFTHVATYNPASVWITLCSLSEPKTICFIDQLSKIEEHFESIKNLLNKTQQEIEQAEIFLRGIEQFLKKVKKFCDPGSFTDDIGMPMLFPDENINFIALEAVRKMKENVIKKIERLKQKDKIESYANTFAPISREYKDEKALSRFFARSIHLRFKEHYKDPMHEKVSILVNSMFETTYTADDIIQMVKSLRTVNLPDLKTYI